MRKLVGYNRYQLVNQTLPGKVDLKQGLFKSSDLSDTYKFTAEIHDIYKNTAKMVFEQINTQ
jgi:hypothetical protein